MQKIQSEDWKEAASPDSWVPVLCLRSLCLPARCNLYLSFQRCKPGVYSSWTLRPPPCSDSVLLECVKSKLLSLLPFSYLRHFVLQFGDDVCQLLFLLCASTCLGLTFHSKSPVARLILLVKPPNSCTARSPLDSPDRLPGTKCSAVSCQLQPTRKRRLP